MPLTSLALFCLCALFARFLVSSNARFRNILHFRSIYSYYNRRIRANETDGTDIVLLPLTTTRRSLSYSFTVTRVPNDYCSSPGGLEYQGGHSEHPEDRQEQPTNAKTFHNNVEPNSNGFSGSSLSSFPPSTYTTPVAHSDDLIRANDTCQVSTSEIGQALDDTESPGGGKHDTDIQLAASGSAAVDQGLPEPEEIIYSSRTSRIPAPLPILPLDLEAVYPSSPVESVPSEPASADYREGFKTGWIKYPISPITPIDKYGFDVKIRAQKMLDTMRDRKAIVVGGTLGNLESATRSWSGQQLKKPALFRRLSALATRAMQALDDSDDEFGSEHMPLGSPLSADGSVFVIADEDDF